MHLVEANGAKIPAIGFGTWTLKGDDCSSLVAHAIGEGYRHIDTADLYDNEEAVGRGIRASGIDRNAVFLTTKVWHTNLAAADFKHSAESSLQRLGVNDVDLLLIHWPSKTVPLAETVGALCEIKDRGLARHVGVSNFPVRLLEEAISLSTHPLVCNQVEYHPMLNQGAVMAACRKHDMAMVSYCPLCRDTDLLTREPIVGLAAKYDRSPAQIVLRWHVQQDGVVCIPRTKTPARVPENFSIFDFELETAEMDEISALNAGGLRVCDYDFSPDWD